MRQKLSYLGYLILVMLVSSLSFSCGNSDKPVNNNEADIIIYGGTSAAISAGLSSGGLGYTDTGDKSVIGGLAREFYHRVWQHYNTNEAWNWQKKEEYGNQGQGTPAMDGENRTMWIFEPHVAEMVFESMVAEDQIRVDRDEWLDRENGVKMENGNIVFFPRFQENTQGKSIVETIKSRRIVSVCV